MNSDAIGAMMQGQAQGKALGGLIPSGQNAGGAPPMLDYAAADLRRCQAGLSALANTLHRNNDEHDANKVVKLLTQLSDIMLERRKKFAEARSDQASGLSPMAAFGSL